MPGSGEPGCTFDTVDDIKKEWPNLEYLPRPEPQEDDIKDHEQWKNEYKDWRNLKCKNQNGGYFCRRHGRWIMCQEVQKKDASPQSAEGSKSQHVCPPRHNDRPETEGRMFQEQPGQATTPLIRNLDTDQPGSENTSPAAYDTTGLESRFREMSISNPRGQPEQIDPAAASTIPRDSQPNSASPSSSRSGFRGSETESSSKSHKEGPKFHPTPSTSSMGPSRMPSTPHHQDSSSADAPPSQGSNCPSTPGSQGNEPFCNPWNNQQSANEEAANRGEATVRIAPPLGTLVSRTRLSSKKI